jgi:hypothetical protein
MFISHDLHRGSSPTPDAYDGSWLELLENPDVAFPYREGSGVQEGPALDAGASPSSPS